MTPQTSSTATPRRNDFTPDLERIAERGSEAITERLAQLDREWTAGRMTKAVISVMVLAGLPLTVFVSPWFALIPAAGGLLLAHYLFARRSWLGGLFWELGYRAGSEIDEERYALKALRGDFRDLPTVHDIEDQDAISRLEGEGGMVIETEHAKVGPREAAHQVATATQQ